MNGTDAGRPVRELFEVAVSDLDGEGFERAPVAAVVAGGRRRRRAARLRAGAVLAVATVGLTGLTGLAGLGLAQLRGPATVTPVASVRPVVDPAAGTVQLGGATVTVPDGWKVDTTGHCAAPDTVVVPTLPGTTGCGRGPSIVISRKVTDVWWQIGVKGGLTLLDGVPVWKATADYSDEAGSETPGATVLSFPAGGVFVLILGTPAQQATLLDAVTLASPSSTSALGGKSGGSPTEAVTISGNEQRVTDRLVTAPTRIARVRAALEAAPAVPPEDWCTPAPADQVLVHLRTTDTNNTDHPDAPGPAQDTDLVTAFTGDCRLAYSANGAVVRPGADFYAALDGPLHPW